MKGSLGLSMQASEGWADLPATTRPLIVLSSSRPDRGGEHATPRLRQAKLVKA
ncbi:MAG TPA: hypothetical protein VG411_07490 [Actinomycetota bacterium]|nr:hypothetical protein [Actinomycetota bacterium]